MKVQEVIMLIAAPRIQLSFEQNKYLAARRKGNLFWICYRLWPAAQCWCPTSPIKIVAMMIAYKSFVNLLAAMCFLVLGCVNHGTAMFGKISILNYRISNLVVTNSDQVMCG